MSSAAGTATQERILETARQLSELGDVPTLSALARHLGMSRQGLYLHFPTRTMLLIALVEFVDEREGLAAEVRAVQAAPDGPSQVRAWATMQARRNPRIASFARALDAARHDDGAAASAWQDRMDNRMRGAQAIVERLRHEGALHADWSLRDAAVLLWEWMSFRVWDDLVNLGDLPPRRYVHIVTHSSLAALAAPLLGEPPG